jgi:hypothetical protein
VSNQVDKQIVEEGWRNAVVKVAAVIDSFDLNLVSFIKPSDFTNNDPRAGRLAGFRVDAVMYSVGNLVDVAIFWNGAQPQLITSVARAGKVDATGDGGFLPDQTREGYDGSINIKTAGFPPGGTPQNLNLFLRLVKLYKQA